MISKEKREEIRASYQELGFDIGNPRIGDIQTILELLDDLDLAESRLSKARETLGKYGDSSYWNNPLGFVVRENGNAKVGKELACDCLAEIGGKDA